MVGTPPQGHHGFMTTSPNIDEQPDGPAPTPETPDPTPTAPPARFFQWLRGLGMPRSSNRWVGGVCGGLGMKWGIDPVIVRGLAVVLTLFFGIGLFAYGVAWALLPEPDGRIHVEEVARGRWSTGMTGAAIATLLGLGGPGSGLFLGDSDGWSLWSTLCIGGIVWLVYWSVNRDKSKNSIPPVQQTQQSSPWTTQGFQPNPAQYVKTKPAIATRHVSAAASFLVIGLATIIGAAVLLLDAGNVIDLAGYEDGIAAAAAAVTAGIGIVLAGVTGRTAGGLGIFGIVALMFAGLLSLSPVTSTFSSFNESRWVPTTIGAAEAGRSLAFGNATFDLTGFDGGTGLANDVEIPLDVVAANATILVPANIPVRVQSELAAASLTIDGQDINKSLAENSTTNLNPEAKGKTLVIILQGAASNVEILVDDAMVVDAP